MNAKDRLLEALAKALRITDLANSGPQVVEESIPEGFYQKEAVELFDALTPEDRRKMLEGFET